MSTEPSEAATGSPVKPAEVNSVDSLPPVTDTDASGTATSAIESSNEGTSMLVESSPCAVAIDHAIANNNSNRKKRPAPSPTTSSPSPAPGASDASSSKPLNAITRVGKDGEPLSEKKLRRLEKNRLSARECRRRKREATENMQGQINQLEGENLRLRLQLQVSECRLE